MIESYLQNQIGLNRFFYGFFFLSMNNKMGNELNIKNETDISVVMCDGELIVNIYNV